MPKNTPFIKDWLVFGFVTGAALSIVKTTVSSALGKRGGPVTMPFGHTAAGLLTGNVGRRWLPGKAKLNKDEKRLGWFVDAMMGGFYGAGTTSVISMSPPGNETLKGAMTGGLFAIATIAAGRVFKVEGMKSLTAKEAFGTIMSGTLVGAAQGTILGRYGSGLVLQSHPGLVKTVDESQFKRGRLQTSQV